MGKHKTSSRFFRSDSRSLLLSIAYFDYMNGRNWGLLLQRENQQNGQIQRIETKIQVETQKEIYCKILAHMITKTEKFRDLLPASQRTRKAGGVKHFIRVHRPGNPKHLCLKAGEEKCLSSNRKQIHSSFCSIQAFKGQDGCQQLGKGGSPLLSLPIQMIISSRSTLTDLPRNNVFPSILGTHDPVKRIVKLTIIGRDRKNNH